jgi:uncharacterized Zn-finger protein
MKNEAPETILVDTTRIACDGSGGTLGHPRVYLEMGDADSVRCGYCDRLFVLSEKAKLARAHGEAAAH